MNTTDYVLCTLILSIMGVVLSYINKQIAICPKNNRENIYLEIGFTIIFIASILVSLFGFHTELIRYGMLIFLALAVVFVGMKTINHLFDHSERRNDLCSHRAYTHKLRKLSDGPTENSGRTS